MDMVFKEVCENVDKFYILFDVDVIDFVFISGIGMLVFGGLIMCEVIFIVWGLCV